MAGDSLGTMTVGVTANVSDAERALNGLANMLERFDRQQQNRQRSSASRQPAFSGLPKYGPYSEEQQFAEMLRKEQVQKEALTKWMFNETRKSEQVAVQVGGTESHMQMLGGKFKHDQRIAAEREALAQQEFNNQEARNGLLLNNHMAMLSAKFKHDQSIAAEREALAQQEFNNQQARDGLLLNNHMAMLSAKFKEDQRIAAEREALAQQEFNNQQQHNGLLLNNHMAMLSAKFKEEQRIAAEREALAQQEQERTGRSLDLHMHQLGQQFKSGAFGGVVTSASQARYAIINLAYGVQDAATVMGTGGFPAAIRASANNLQGLAIFFDKAAFSAGGLGEALMTPEVGILAVSTAVMIAADAWERYEQKLQKAAEESAKAKFERFQPGEKGQDAARLEGMKIELQNAETIAEQEAILKKKQEDDRIAAAKEAADAMDAAQIRAEKTRIEKILDQKKQIGARLAAQQAQMPMGQGAGGGFVQFEAAKTTPEEQRIIALDERQLRADLAEVTKKLKEQEENVNEVVGERIRLLKEQDLALQKIKETEKQQAGVETQRMRMRFEDAGEEELRKYNLQQESDLEYRLRFLKTRRQQISDRARKQMDPVGYAGFESSEAYEALARSRMKQDPQTDLLQKIVKEEEKATKALEDIREQLDPGRRAKIAVLEKL